MTVLWLVPDVDLIMIVSYMCKITTSTMMPWLLLIFDYMLIKCIPYNPGLKGKTVKLNASKLHFTKRNIIGMIVLRLAEKSLYAVKYR